MCKTLLFVGLAFGCVFLVGNCSLVCYETDSTTPSDSDKSLIINDNVTTLGPEILTIVNRAEWLAQPPISNLTNLELPAKRVVIAHTATEGCFSNAECVFRTRFIQTFHMESRGWDDIAYNFLIGGNGFVYVGRDWDKMGTHTKEYNQDSIGIAFIGTFNSIEPSEKQLLAAQRLLELGIQNGKLHPNYRLLGHRQLMATQSPGDKLYEIIKTWPHWSSSVEIDS